jgi:PAS domain S-box-containing protein
MLDPFHIEKLNPEPLSERLLQVLDDARRVLHLHAVAIAEVAAEHGTVAPRWRVWSPRARSPLALNAQLFDQLVLAATPRLATDAELQSLQVPFDDCPCVTLLALDVVPVLRAGPDALLICGHERYEPLSEALLLQLKRCLEHGLSLDRRARLAETVFQAVQQAADPMELTDSHARLLYANAAWEQTFGYAAPEAVGQTVGSLFRDPVAPIHDTAFYQFTLATIANGNAWSGALACRARDGQRVFCEPMVSRFDARDQGFSGNFAVRRNLTQRAERDAALAIAHHEFRAVLSTVPDGVAVLRDGKLYFVNAAFLTMVGRSEEEVIGSAYIDLVYADDRRQFLAAHGPGVARVRMLRADGSVRFAEISTAGQLSFEGKPATILLSRDITEQRIAEEQLARAERLSALGSLAAGVAHEINNPLSYVLLNLRQLEHTGELPGNTRAALANALDGASRIQQIAQELRSFCGPDGHGPPEPVSVTKAATSAINIAQNEIRHRARLERRLEDDLHVLAHEGQLVQVLVNLLVNAAQAIPEGDGRQHVIHIRTQSLSERRAQLEISDSGVGIAPDVLPHVFEPFSTTKRRGEGSGLGLAISKRIVEDLGGHISIHSVLGHGCSVRIELPRTHRDAITARYRRPLQESKVVPSKLRLLVIDDEVAIASTLQDVLLDYDVTISVAANEALDILAADSRFDIVLCDLMMPGMTGPELYREACRMRPELSTHFIFMTGGAFTDWAREFLERTRCPVLDKPFTVASACRVIEQNAKQEEVGPRSAGVSEAT